jgi:hypothetical protein
MKLQEPIRTPRLVIRSYTNADREFLLSTWGDRENGKYMVDPARENQDERYLSLIDKMEDGMVNGADTVAGYIKKNRRKTKEEERPIVTIR